MSLLIISPSGRFYGSEQVLYDYLAETSLQADVYVPSAGIFKDKLKALGSKHRIVLYNASSIALFYLRVFWFLVTGKYKTIYCNEAGHVKYISLLARIFRKKKFFIHVRLNEDTDPGRWLGDRGDNLKVFVISDHIQSQLSFPAIRLYDPYRFASGVNSLTECKEPMKIGIIGRISINKGFDHLISLLNYLKTEGATYDFIVYGEPDQELITSGSLEILKAHPNVQLMGFCDDKDTIYRSIDCVLHLCPTEPLGRIFLESIDFNIPLVGFKSGGIGEIGKMTGLDELLVNPDGNDVTATLANALGLVRSEYQRLVRRVTEKKEIASTLFDSKTYAAKLDGYFSGQLTAKPSGS